MLEELFEAVAPFLFEMFGAILMLVLTFVAAKVNGYLAAFTTVKIEKKHLDTLHSAVMTGVLKAFEEGKGDPAQMARIAVEYAKKSAPDAIRTLIKDPGQIDDILLDLAKAKAMKVVKRLVD